MDVFERFLEEGQGWVENNIDACCHCAYCHKELGHEQAALAALFRSFTYDRPRAEVCCEIGNCFLRQERYQQAALLVRSGSDPAPGSDRQGRLCLSGLLWLSPLYPAVRLLQPSGSTRKERKPSMNWPPPVNRIHRRFFTTGLSFKACQSRCLVRRVQLNGPTWPEQG